MNDVSITLYQDGKHILDSEMLAIGVGDDVDFLKHAIEERDIINPSLSFEPHECFNNNSDYVKEIVCVYPIITEFLDYQYINSEYIGLLAVEEIIPLDEDDINFLYKGIIFSYVEDVPIAADAVCVLARLDVGTRSFDLIRIERNDGEESAIRQSMMVATLKGGNNLQSD